MARVLRYLGAAVVIMAALFKIQHWPWVQEIALAGWGLVCIGLVIRWASGTPMAIGRIGRDVLILGFVSHYVLKLMHWPGAWIALSVMLAGLLGTLAFSNEGIIGGSRKGPDRILFTLASIVVVVGAVFKIQHWPLAGMLLLAGLSLAALAFVIQLFRKGEDPETTEAPSPSDEGAPDRSAKPNSEPIGLEEGLPKPHPRAPN